MSQIITASLNNFKKITFILGLLAIGAAPQKSWSNNNSVSVDAGSPGFETLYVRKFSIGERFNSYVETSNSIGTDAATGKFSVSHTFVRAGIDDKSAGTFWGTTLKMNYRYLLPTAPSLRQAGALGAIAVRPSFVKNFGNLSLFVRPTLSVFLQRNGYQLNPVITAKDPVAKANPLLRTVIEIAPEYAFKGGLEGFSVGYYLANSNTFQGVTPNGGKTSLVGEYLQEVSLGLPSSRFGGAEVALIATSKASYAKGTKFSDFAENLFSKVDNWAYIVRVIHSF